MPLTDKGTKILANMVRHYGSRKGREVFYVMIDEGKLTKVEHVKKGKIK